MKKSSALIKIAVRYEPDVVTARQKARRLAGLLGLDGQDQVRLATAVSEIARNAFQYAGGGVLDFALTEERPQALLVKISDQGPGIKNLDDIEAGTYISQTGMGVGLMGSRKLVDDFEIESIPGRGTTVTFTKYLPSLAPLIEKKQITRIMDELAGDPSESAFEDIQAQNRALIQALEDARKTREELARLNEELAETNRGVVALYAELDDKAASLKKANEVKTRFLSHMTHEFRTPLSSIISLTRILLNETDGEINPEQEKQIQYIRKSGESLLELVNNLLDLAKVEAGRITIQPADFEVEEVLGGVRGMFRPLLGSDTRVELVVDEAAKFALHTDLSKVSQILRNLVSNAIKFTPEGVVRVSALLNNKDFVEFTVADTGVGIASESRAQIFEDFVQVDNPLQHKHKGTGLGLPLSRRLAQLLGGDITLVSTPGQGSIFTVRIPRIYKGSEEGQLIDGRPEEKRPPVAESGSRFRVLLVDDEEPARYVLRRLVSDEIDADFEEAATGLAALDRIKFHAPDLVFLDLRMPDMNGFETLDYIKALPEMQNVPVIVRTSAILTEAQSAQLLERASAILTKEPQKNETEEKEALRRALATAGFDYQAENL